jgi:predicted nucleic acid-binding protein
VIVFVDTSAFIALLDEDDVRHGEAARAFRWLAANTTLVTHNYVQVETIALARRRLGVRAVQRLTDALFPVVRTIWVDEAVHASALAAHRSGGSASFVDQVSFVVMREHGLVTAFAFDPDFQAQGFGEALMPRDADRHEVNEERAHYGDLPAADLVSVAEISERAGRSINTIQSWRRRHADFPAPAAQLSAGPIWSWPAIATWISGRDRRRRPPARLFGR